MKFPAKKEKWGTWRFELKYRISQWQYYQIKNAITPYMKPDEFTLAQLGGAYLVRSLYYDTHNYQAYHEKIGGDFGRIKIRTRSYTDIADENTKIRVELKTKRGSAMEKFSSFVPYSSYAAFMETGHWPAYDSPVLTEFERLYYLRTLKPKLLVQYRRLGLKSRFGENLRITFDMDVRSADSSSLFPATPFFRVHDPNLIILEIKCQSEQPQWLSKLVKQYGLKIVANSKYTRGIEISRPDAVTPMWSQGFANAPARLQQPGKIGSPVGHRRQFSN
ncbi:polyphosphate polymerase domain-containing protein [Dethiobacter alkaliphilus]|uniref:VTC domain-containing protein n=1 Tax=Dethiobacter alkaliphilus AHT 1 TaxID=555088 RepID=C0GEB2_DETAL|nr:polyphosphate polymerase domain-containing protein [Dethiobacter alkaliphilus]EEG78406.1 conserved hypothetical protein [Dethiobacter alkaliphilus AHT 1]